MFYIGLLILAFFAGSFIQPSFAKEGGSRYFYYSLGSGNRNKIKLW